MKIEDSVEGKRILVTGGTGSFGNQIVTQLRTMGVTEIVIASRDEKKQYDMKNKYEADKDVLRFEIADVREYSRIRELMRDVDVVYHAAALKHVPNCETQPFEAVKTNIIGAENVRNAAVAENVTTVVAISTDKAVKPVNAMGMTKALQEKIMLRPQNHDERTNFVCVRYGNVIGSRGSVIPYFREQILQNKPLPITHPEMTRFMLTLPEAVSLVFEATVNGSHGEIFVKKMPACKITDLAKVMGNRLRESDGYPTFSCGIRPGEKIHEVLVSEEEMRRSSDIPGHYVIHPYESAGKPTTDDSVREYTSLSTHQMNLREIEEMLEKCGWLSLEGAPILN